MKKALPLLALALALTGCVNIGGQNATPPVVYYVLKDAAPAGTAPAAHAESPKDADSLRTTVPQGGMEPNAPQGGSGVLRAEAREIPHAPTLLVLDTTTSGFYDTDQLIFSRSAGTRSRYQFARWTERPGKRFASLMRARLDQQGGWNVSAASGYVRGDLLLDTELVEFYHDAASKPGQVRMKLRAELIDMKKHSLRGRRVFEQKVPLTTYDAAGAARASSLAVGRMLDELTDWLATFR
jgi:cholesterol transport system auxiliary component